MWTAPAGVDPSAPTRRGEPLDANRIASIASPTGRRRFIHSDAEIDAARTSSSVCARDGPCVLP